MSAYRDQAIKWANDSRLQEKYMFDGYTQTLHTFVEYIDQSTQNTKLILDKIKDLPEKLSQLEAEYQQ